MAYIVFSSLIIIIVGCLLHFVYDWTKKKKIIALFGAVNESTWEHIKIALVPTIVVNIIYLLTLKTPRFYLPAFLPALAMSLLVILVCIPVFFYTLKKITKKEILWLDITIFCIAIILGQIAFKTILTNLSNPASFIECPDYALSCDYSGPIIVSDALVFISLIFNLCIVTAVLFFTFFPPKNFLFADPRNGKYGLESGEKHCHRHMKSKKQEKKVKK